MVSSTKTSLKLLTENNKERYDWHAGTLNTCCCTIANVSLMMCCLNNIWQKINIIAVFHSVLKWLAKELKHIRAGYTTRKWRRCNRMASHFWISNVRTKKKRLKKKKKFRRSASCLECTMCDQWFHEKCFYM